MPNLSDHLSPARQFLNQANHLVDEILSPESASPRVPVGFRVQPDIVLPPLRYGRTRLFLSRFIGRSAWRLGVTQ